MTDHPTTPDPLDRLRAFDAVEPPDQWDDIVHRAETGDGDVPLALVDESSRPRGRWVLAAAAAVVLLVGAIVIVANRDDDGGIAPATVPPTTASDVTVPGPATSTPTTTQPPSTSSPTTTTPPVSTTAPVIVTTPPTTPPSTAPSLPVLPCAPFDATPPDGAWSPLDPALGELGSLATEPNLVLTSTDLPPVDGSTSGHVITDIDRIAGGIVVFVRADYDWGYAGWQLVAIDDSGEVRWQRCGDDAVTDMIVGPAGAERAVVDLPGPSAWHSFDLATGADATSLDIPVGYGWEAQDDRYLVVSPEGPASGEAGGPIRLVDLLTGSVTDLGTPPPGPEFFGYGVTTRDDGSPLVTMSENPGHDVTLAVYLDGEWRKYRDTLMAEGDIWVTETFDGDTTGQGPGLLARDPLGATVWFQPTTGGLPGEGFRNAVVGDVVLANVCDVLGADGVCEDITFQARDLLTGDLLWERPGYGSPVAWSDRYVFAGSALLDLRTGDDVQQGTFPDATFLQSCCGEGTFVYTGFDGGVVWAVNYEQVQVFYPAAAARPTTRIDLTQ